MKNKSNCNALLLEMVIVLILFTFSAVALTGAYYYSYCTAQKTAARDAVVSESQSLADRLYLCGMDASVLTEAGYDLSESGLWEKQLGKSLVTVTLSQEETAVGSLAAAKITAVYEQEPLLVLPVSRYTAKEASQ